MATTHVFSWLDNLEKDFDRTYVNIDILIGNGVTTNAEIEECRKYLGNLNSIFTQVSVKIQSVCEKISRAEAYELSIKSDLETALAEKSFAEKEVEHLILELHNSQLKLLKYSEEDVSTESIRKSLEQKLEERKVHLIGEDRFRNALAIQSKESYELKKYISALQVSQLVPKLLNDEVYGARMASKYLDKELAGRIQQIQLLCKKMDGPEHERLWNTLESEILLHRHKTVVRACRGRHNQSTAEIISKMGNRVRKVSVYRSPTDGMGISVTGGLEHGVPIMISEILPGQLAHQSKQFFVGDAILSVNGYDLRDKRHREAVEILSAQQGQLDFYLLFLNDDESDDENVVICEDTNGFKFRLYDDTKILPSRFLFQVQQRTKQLRNHRNSVIYSHSKDKPTNNDTGQHSSHIFPAIEDAAEYQRFVEMQTETKKKIALAQLCNPSTTDYQINQECHIASKLNENNRQTIRNTSKLAVYDSYFWNPMRNGTQRQAIDGNDCSNDATNGPNYSRNPQELLYTNGRVLADKNQKGDNLKSSINQKPLPKSRASRSATIIQINTNKAA